MLVKVVMVGTGSKWHIARTPDFTYCGVRPSWTSDGETEISEIFALCANCKKRISREGIK